MHNRAIKIARISANLKQQEVADACGITQPRYSDIERGVTPDDVLKQKIAETLGAPISSLWPVETKVAA